MAKKKDKDFKKVKLKVGKKKPQKENETKVAFKSQGIVVPEQSISEDKGEPTTLRNQTLKELLSHLKHYNPNMRKESVSGIKDMFQRHPSNILLHLSSLFDATFPLIIDEDHGVRAAMLSFMMILTPHLTKNNVSPFVNHFMSYCGSAMTHIYEDIRLSSLDFFNLWIQAFPDLLTSSDVQILPNFLSLLSNFDSRAGGDKASKLISAPSGKIGTSKSRTSILSSFHIYLLKVFESNQPGSLVHVLSHEAHQRKWSADDPVALNPYPKTPFLDQRITTLQSIQDQLDKAAAGQTVSPALDNINFRDRSHVRALNKVLMEILTECWIEAVPGISTEYGSPGAPAQRETLKVVLRLVALLFEFYSKFPEPMQDKEDEAMLRKYLGDLRKHFLPHFPFGSQVLVKKDKKDQEYLNEINLLFCRASSVLFSMDQGSQRNKDWRGLVTSHLTETFKLLDLHKELLPLELLRLFLETVHGLLPLSTPKVSFELLQGLHSYSESLPLSSPARQLFAEFLASLWSESKHSLEGHTGAVFSTWLTELPRYLWELQDQNPAFSSMILAQLSFLARNRSEVATNLFTSIQLSLIPFFYVSVGNPGKEKGVFGPFVKLPSEQQRRAIELLYYFSELPDKLMVALSHCANDRRVGGEEVSFLLQLVVLKQGLFREHPDVLLSFLLSVMVGHSRSDMARIASSAKRSLPSSSSTTSSSSSSTSSDQPAPSALGVVVPCELVLRHFLQREEAEPGKKRKAGQEEASDLHIQHHKRAFWQRRLLITEAVETSVRRLELCTIAEFFALVLPQIEELLASVIPEDTFFSLLRMLAMLPPDQLTTRPDLVGVLGRVVAFNLLRVASLNSSTSIFSPFEPPSSSSSSWSRLPEGQGLGDLLLLAASELVGKLPALFAPLLENLVRHTKGSERSFLEPLRDVFRKLLACRALFPPTLLGDSREQIAMVDEYLKGR